MLFCCGTMLQFYYIWVFSSMMQCIFLHFFLTSPTYQSGLLLFYLKILVHHYFSGETVIRVATYIFAGLTSWRFTLELTPATSHINANIVSISIFYYTFSEFDSSIFKSNPIYFYLSETSSYMSYKIFFKIR